MCKATMSVNSRFSFQVCFVVGLLLGSVGCFHPLAQSTYPRHSFRYRRTIYANRDSFLVNKSGSVSQYHTDSKYWPLQLGLEKLELVENDILSRLDEMSCVASRNATNRNVPESVETGNISFVDVAKSLGIHHVRCDKNCITPTLYPARLNATSPLSVFWYPEQMTGGAAVGDYNNDGLEDIYFTLFSARSILYKNNGDNTFTDVTEETGIGPALFGNGASWADIDQDGDLDLYVTTAGDRQHHLYVNYGGWFKEEALSRNCSLQFPNKRRILGMTGNFGDFDGDGYPDLHVTEWVPEPLGKPSATRLLRNKGKLAPGHFEDVTDQYGVEIDHLKTKPMVGSGSYPFGSSFTDFDNDGLADLLVSIDFGQSRMFWNMGKDKLFKECTEDCGLQVDQDAMGHAIGDYDNNGLMDWFSSAIMEDTTECEKTACMFGDTGNRLYKNIGNRTFSDITDQAGVRNGSWAWGTAFLDFNNDGYQDIVLTNGMNLSTTTDDDAFEKHQMRLWQNLGEGFNGKTKEVSSELGMTSTKQGRGLLKWDFDDDGDVDVVICNNVEAPEIYKNIGGNKQKWIKIKALHSCKQRSEFLCNSLGARIQVRIQDNGHTQYQEIGSSTHFLAQSEITSHFGLGSMATNLSVRVTWPATKSQLDIYNVPPNIRLHVVEPSSGNEKIEFSSLKVCPTLKIIEITKQPMKGVVTINADGKTVRFTKHPVYSFEEMGTQEFTYKIQSYPQTPDTSESTVSVSFVEQMKTTDGNTVCRAGKPSEFEKLTPTEERRFDGLSNNKKHLMWGAVGGNLRRSASPAYSDGIASPASVCNAEDRTKGNCTHREEYSGFGSSRPSPREISNLLFRQTRPIISARRINDFHVSFGQFISHDTDLTPTLPRYNFQDKLNDLWLPITVPKGDVYFDFGDSHSLPFVRSIYNRCTGRKAGTPRQQINAISSYIDGNMVYGMNEERNRHLRTFKEGKMKVWHQELLPFNTAGLPNANNIGRKTKLLFVAGDTRANEQPGLTAIHTIFVREHNRICNMYLKRKPNATDEEVFQYARNIVASEIQAITFREYLPSILGGSEDIPPYTGYKENVDATADHILATAALRFGHSQINQMLWRLDENYKPIKEGHLPLRDAYFAPERLTQEGGIDPLIRGLLYEAAQEVDTKMVDDVRNFMFAFNRRGEDLSSINIQRGRDHGLPDLNTVRAAIGLPKHKTFAEITSNEETAMNLQKIYGDIDNVDLWVGGLAEDHQKGEVGPTFRKILIDSFVRFRDGDRFWYKNILTAEEIELVENLTLSEIIRLNTNISNVPRHVFYSTLYCADVQNERCIEREVLADTTCKHTSEEIGVRKTLEELRAKNEKIKRNLTNLQKQMPELEKKKQDLLYEVRRLKAEKERVSDSESKGTRLLGDNAVHYEVLLFVLLGFFFLLTITFGVLYFRSRSHCHDMKSRDLSVSKETVTSKL